jgi:hypothetical protein
MPLVQPATHPGRRTGFDPGFSRSASWNSAFDRPNGRKLNYRPIAHELDDAALVFGEERINDLREAP